MTVPMRHPDITDYPDGYPVAVNEDQVLLWEGRGWVRVEAGLIDFSGMRKGQLLDAAEAAGLDIPEKVTVAQLRELLEQDQNERLAVLSETPEASAPAEEED